MDSTVATDTSTWTRWAPLGAIAFAILFTVGLIIVGETADYADPQGYETFLADDGNRSRMIMGGYLLILSVFTLLWFVTGLVNRLRATLGSSQLPTVVLASGVVVVALLLVATTVLMSVPASMSFGGAPVPSGEIAVQFEQLGITLILFPSLFAAAVFVASSSIVGRQAGLLPTWLYWVGLVVAAVLLFGAFWIPMLVFLLWALVMGIVLLLRSRGRTGERTRTGDPEHRVQ